MSVESSTCVEKTDELTKEDIWSFRDEVIQLGFDIPELALIEALPASGKSRRSMEWAAETGNNVTLLAPRHNLLDKEYEPWCDKFELTSKRLPSFYRDCTSFEAVDKGNPVPLNKAAEELQEDYRRGHHGEDLHARHSNLPCQEDGECPYIQGLSFDPTNYDVLLGTYRHAHIEDWIEDRYVVFDEFPGSAFLKTFDGEMESVITAYLQDRDDLPFSSYGDFDDNYSRQASQDSIEAWKEEVHQSLRDSTHARRSLHPSANTMAPLAMLAVANAESLNNNWKVAKLGSGRKAILNPESYNWTFLLPPDLRSAESVIGLDGTPNEDLWCLALNQETQSLPLLNTEGKEKYVQEILGLRFVQTTEKWKAIQSGQGASPPKDLALIEGISQKEGQKPALISSNKAIKQYRRNGLDKITETVEHYNDLKGMNTFETERVGIIIGNPHPGDDKIQKWSAFDGVSAEVTEVDGEELRGNDTDYGRFGNSIMKTFIHDEVLQAAMRFGRKKVDGVRGATVYLHTSAIPEWLPVEKQIPSIQSWIKEDDKTHGMRDTIDAIHSVEGWSTHEWRATSLYDGVSVSDKWVRDCLDDLTDYGYIKFEGKKGQGQPKHYTNICLEDAGNFGHVDFSG